MRVREGGIHMRERKGNEGIFAIYRKKNIPDLDHFSNLSELHDMAFLDIISWRFELSLYACFLHVYS